jgi:hypothetical protein
VIVHAGFWIQSASPVSVADFAAGFFAMPEIREAARRRQFGARNFKGTADDGSPQKNPRQNRVVKAWRFE